MCTWIGPKFNTFGAAYFTYCSFTNKHCSMTMYNFISDVDVFATLTAVF